MFQWDKPNSAGFALVIRIFTIENGFTIKISELYNLGPKSELHLAEVGINSAQDLRGVGAAQAYVRLRAHLKFRTSLNLLYALDGALTDTHCIELCTERKLELQLEVEALTEMFHREHSQTVLQSEHEG